MTTQSTETVTYGYTIKTENDTKITGNDGFSSPLHAESAGLNHLGAEDFIRRSDGTDNSVLLLEITRTVTSTDILKTVR